MQKRFLQVSLRYLRKDVAFDEMDREKDDLESYRAKFHGKLAGYAEEAKMIALPTPKYFIVVVDEEKST